MRQSHAHAAMLAALTLVLVATRGAKAEDDQSLVAAGHAFAQRVCWVCHVVGKEQTEKPILDEPGPSFLEIAQRPDLTPESLRKFLLAHDENLGRAGKMPNPRLLDYQIDKVVAYIMSLRGK